MTEDATPDARDPRARPAEDAAAAWDDALCRFEDLLLGEPYDRALPDLAELLDRARVPLTLVEHDDRARKLLGEALLARPADQGDPVRRARVRVEFLVLEVEVLTERLRDPRVSEREARRAAERIEDVAGLLDRLTEGP